MKKPLTTSAWAGLINLILGAIMTPILLIYREIPQNIVFVYSIIGGILGILFLYGFAVLGKKFGAQLLLVMSWIGMGISALWIVIGVIVNLGRIASAQSLGNGIGQDQLALTSMLFLFWIVLCLIIGAYTILFGVGLLKLKDKLEYSKSAGVVNIVAGATMVIVIGYFIKIAALVLEMVLMFRAARKFEHG